MHSEQVENGAPKLRGSVVGCHVGALEEGGDNPAAGGRPQERFDPLSAPGEGSRDKRQWRDSEAAGDKESGSEVGFDTVGSTQRTDQIHEFSHLLRSEK